MHSPYSDQLNCQASEKTDLYFDRINLDHIDKSDLSFESPGGIFLKVKYFLNYLAAAFLFCAMLPIMLAAAFTIKVTDGGPVLYTQIRVGLNNQDFALYKFRSMRLIHQSHNLDSDNARVTWVGRFIRRSKIDELPQLYNVLIGEMSLIGPRPEKRDLVNEYEQQITHYACRHTVKPGITGWAQVQHGYVSNLEQTCVKLEYDLYYIKYLSLRLEMLIMAKTLVLVAKGFLNR